MGRLLFGVVVSNRLADPGRLADLLVHLPRAGRGRVATLADRVPAAAAGLPLLGHQGEQQGSVVVGPLRLMDGDRTDQAAGFFVVLVRRRLGLLGASPAGVGASGSGCRLDVVPEPGVSTE